MKQYAVIVAGGSGQRMGGGMPKQFRSLCGRPVLWWSMKAFHNENPSTRLIIVLPEEFISLWNDFFTTLPEEERFTHEVVAGGETRSASVQKGLSLIQDDISLVAIHDGARPLVDVRIISDGWKEAEEFEAAIPVIPVVDSLRIKSGGENKAVDRNSFVAVQTPQVFFTSLLKQAYKEAGENAFSDDASVVENIDHPISMFQGHPDNIKITNPQDMAIAALLMGKNA